MQPPHLWPQNHGRRQPFGRCRQRSAQRLQKSDELRLLRVAQVEQLELAVTCGCYGRIAEVIQHFVQRIEQALDRVDIFNSTTPQSTTTLPPPAGWLSIVGNMFGTADIVPKDKDVMRSANGSRQGP